MKSKRLLSAFAALALLAGLAVGTVRGGTMTASTNAPAITGDDIYSCGTMTGADKWWVGEFGGGKGQTFRTGSGASAW